MKRVLFVSSNNPFVCGGGSQATRAYMDATIDIFGREMVDIVIPAEAKIPTDCKDCNFILAPKRPLWKSLLLLPFGVTGRQEILVTDIINKHKGKYFLCIYNGRGGGYCFKRIKTLDIKKIIIHHNEEVEYCMTTKHFATLFGHWPFLVKKIQQWAYKYADANFFLTIQDMHAFKQLYGPSNAGEIVIGTFETHNAPINIPKREKKDFTMVESAALDAYQTVHGIQDFYNRYLKIANGLIPKLRILLTGRNPDRRILQLEEKHSEIFTIISNPEDIMAQVQRGQIFMNPTDVGGGLKLRNMDGLKAGLPVLTHEVSARGYDFYIDKPYFRVYNDEKSFENGLRNILDFLDKTPNSQEMITHDYNEYFGYQNGMVRMKEGLEIDKPKKSL